MANIDSRTTRLLDSITALYPWAHGHQKKGLTRFVGAVLEIKSCTQAKLASAFEKKKAALKQLSRLWHNERLRTAELAEVVATEIVGRRGVPLYWRAYPADSLKGHRSHLERAFLQRLCEVILRDLPRPQLLLTADRGFADVLLFDLLERLHVAFIIRTRESVKVCDDGQWRKLKTLRMRGNTRRRSLGRVRYCQRSERRLFLTQSRARNRQGRWGIWWLVSNRNFTALQATQEYQRRWGCECGFRDAKHLLGLKEAEIEDPQAYARMFTLVAIALLLLAIIGCAFLVADARARQRLRAICADRSTHCELSLCGACCICSNTIRDYGTI